MWPGGSPPNCAGWSTAPGIESGVAATPLATPAAAGNLAANSVERHERIRRGVDLTVAMRGAAPAALIAACLALLPATASAQIKLIDEIKLGGLAHDVTFGGRHLESGADINLEMLFTPPDILRVLGSPRPHIGADINTSGNTSDGYFGLTWGIMLIQSLFGAGDGVFANGSLGGAIHDGFIDTAPAGRKRLGSRVLFRESAELGYQITPNASVSAMVDHISNANLGNHNAGITSAGARFGFKF
jgi:lipid A 3-O-deacylase